jgi:hypothetical protein
MIPAPLRPFVVAALACISTWGDEIALDEKEWTFVGGSWAAVHGTLSQSVPDHLNSAFYRAQAYASPELSASFHIRPEGTGVQAAGLILCSTDSRSGYYVHYDARNDQIILSCLTDAGRRELARRRHIRIDTGRWHMAKATVRNGHISVYFDNHPVLQVDDDTLDGGLLGLYTSQGAVDYARIAAMGEAMPLPDWRERHVWEVPTKQHGAEIMETKAIAKQTGRYIGWPTICRRHNGELLVVFSGDRDEHVCPWGKVQLVRSADDGETWSEPVTICNTPLDDRDAGIIETAQGTLVMNWFTSLAFEPYATRRAQTGSVAHGQWLRHAEKLSADTRDRWLGFWTKRSTDGGKTWEEPVRHAGTTPHGPIELADGRLLMVGRRTSGQKVECVVEQSTDDARTWQVLATIEQNPDDDAAEYYEPHVVETADGGLVAMFRYHNYAGEPRRRESVGDFLRQAESQDGGKTWTTAHTTPLLGYPPHLTRLRDGRLLCVWGRRLPPFGEYACLSSDNGKTWDVDHQIHLAAASDGDLGYPASVELPDGRILTVYYQVDKAGEKTCLMGTLWRPPATQ